MDMDWAQTKWDLKGIQPGDLLHFHIMEAVRKEVIRKGVIKIVEFLIRNHVRGKTFF